MTTRWIMFAIGAALPIMFAGTALADDHSDKLMALCKAENDKPETCDCQVKAIVDNADPRFIDVVLQLATISKDAKPEDADKAMKDALAKAGMTEDEFKKLSEEQSKKIDPLIEACKK